MRAVEVAAPIVVLHEFGHVGGAEQWRSALVGAGWSGPLVVPDLPGHGIEPAPVGGAYDLVDPAFVAVQALAGTAAPGTDQRPAPLVVGVGTSGWSAWLLALGGRASALVLVDGLGGPWAEPADVVAHNRARLRAIADDRAAVLPPPPTGPDPRLVHGVPAQRGRGLAVRAAAATAVPAMVVETPGSALTHDDAADLVSGFAGGATLVEVSDRAPAVVAPAVLAWAELAWLDAI